MRRMMLALGALMLLPATHTLHAQGWIERPDRGPVPAAPSPVTRVGSTVRLAVEGRVLRVEVEELFRNGGSRIEEGSYLYPMAGEGVFSDFSLFQGDQELKGEMMDATRARDIYQAIVRRQKDPALLTLAGHGLIRAQVFPIQPGETRKIILRYTVLLSRDGAAWRVRYPLGVRGAVPVAITATVAGADRLGVPWSPTHPLDWRTTDGRMTIRAEARPGADFELMLPEQGGTPGMQVLSHAPGGDERHFMLVVTPPAAPSTATLPRDLVLVADVSGSMAGAKLEQARAALRQTLDGLRPTDRFRLVTFSSRVVEFAGGFVPATRQRVREAQAFVDQLTANGGTNLEGALAAALRDRPGTNRLGIVVLLSDGLPSVGEQSPERLAASAAAGRGDLRVFPIGVGHDVNTWLLDRLAVEGRGRVEYVAPEASVETAVGALLTRIDRPVLTDLRIVESPVQLVERAPADLPDLYAGEELVLLGRYGAAGRGRLVLEGTRNGRRERIEAQVDFARHQTDNRFIAPLWASRRIGELTRQARLEGNTPALVERIRELGLRYGILTEYTSYLVLEPEAVANAGPWNERERRDAAPLPAAAPAAQTGADAFRRAERSAQLVDAKNLAASEAVVGRGNRPAEPGHLPSRRVGNRLFVLRGAVWTDVAHTDTLKVVTIAPFSPAYFALAEALPALREWLAVGDALVVAGRRVSLRIAPEGATAWSPGQLEQVLREFRGS